MCQVRRQKWFNEFSKFLLDANFVFNISPRPSLYPFVTIWRQKSARVFTSFHQTELHLCVMLRLYFLRLWNSHKNIFSPLEINSLALTLFAAAFWVECECILMRTLLLLAHTKADHYLMAVTLKMQEHVHFLVRYEILRWKTFKDILGGENLFLIKFFVFSEGSNRSFNATKYFLIFEGWAETFYYFKKHFWKSKQNKK